MHGVPAWLCERRGRVKDTSEFIYYLWTHAAQLGWNTCNPSLLSGFAFCWHIYCKRQPFFISSAWLAHTPNNHTHEPSHTHTRTHTHTYVTLVHTLSTIRHYSFPLAVHPVNCYVVCYIDSLISFVHFSFGYTAFTGLLYNLFLNYFYIQDSFSLSLVLHLQINHIFH